MVSFSADLWAALSWGSPIPEYQKPSKCLQLALRLVIGVAFPNEVWSWVCFPPAVPHGRPWVTRVVSLSWLVPSHDRELGMDTQHTLGMGPECVLGKMFDIHSPAHWSHDLCLHLQGEELLACLRLSVCH